MEMIFNVFILFGFGMGVIATLIFLIIISTIIYFIGIHREKKLKNRKE